MANYNFILAFGLILSFCSALIYIGIPEDLQLLNDVDLTIFSTEIVTVAGTCVVATGIPCAAIMIFWSILNIYTFLVISSELAKLLIITPILLTVIYIISELARGK